MRRALPKFTALILLLPCAAAVAQDDTTREDRRISFRYSAGNFDRVDDIRWIERRDKDAPSHFEETDRTDRYIQLYDKDRHVAVRLYRDRGEAYDRKSNSWNRWPGSEGAWRRPQRARRD